MRLLYICDAVSGGISEYAIRQVPALMAAGVQVTVLCRRGFPVDRLHGCQVATVLPDLPTGGSRWRKVLDRIGDGQCMAKAVAAAAGAHDVVLMACYSEYFAPFWAPIYRRLAKQGIPIATIAHDPVRDFVLGPAWWHRWSVRQGYSFVRDVFVHDDTPVDFGGPMPQGVRVHQIPHGPFELAAPISGREVTRKRYGFGEKDRVFLAFGQIRDGKNLDRFLRSMKELPSRVKLLLAGSAASGSQRQPEDYLMMAKELGVDQRCVCDFRYVPDEETGDLFAAADVILMGYSAKFRSASGVLNAAVASRKPVLASSGDGPLKSAMINYQLGVWVTADDDRTIRDGALHILTTAITPEWDRYEKENSWEENARRVVQALCN